MKEPNKGELIQWLGAIEEYINQLPKRYHLEGFDPEREKVIMEKIRKLIINAKE